MPILPQNAISFTGGLNRDLSPERKGEEYFFANNFILESSSESLGKLLSEKGNINDYTFDTSPSDLSVIIGHINLTQDKVILFFDDNSIYLQDESLKTCTLLVKSSSLNFSKNNYITGLFKVVNGCEKVIYWRDSLNPDRYLNIDSLTNHTQYKTSTLRYTQAEANSLDKWDIDTMSLRPTYDKASIDNIEVLNTGGQLELGVYRFAVSFSDESNTFTEWSNPTSTIPIVSGNYGAGYSTIKGGDPGVERKTTKSISFQINNIDTSFNQVKIAVIQTINGTDTPYELGIFDLNSSGSYNYTFTGLDLNSAIQLDMADITVDNPVYTSSKCLIEHDSRLIQANLTTRSLDHYNFQRTANAVTLNYFTKAVEYNKSNDNEFNPKSSSYYVDNRSYMRDEVYAFAIVWVYKDNTVTPAYPLIGKEKNTNTISTSYGRPTLAFGDNTILYGGTPDTNHISQDPTETIEAWKVYNTCERTDTDPTQANGYYTFGNLAYWQSEYDYPDTTCNGNRLYPTGKIRHHKMPDTTTEPHFLGKTQSYTNLWENGTPVNSLIPEYNNATNVVDLNNDIDQNKEYILPLGIKFSNIGVPPVSDADEIVGYYIVRAKRDDYNKSVIDKGLIFNNTIYTMNVGNQGSFSIPPYVGNAAPSVRVSYSDNDRFDVEERDEWTKTAPYYIDPSTNASYRTWYGPRGAFGDPTNYNDGQIVASPPTSVRSLNSLSFHGPVSKFYNNTGNPSYLKFERYLQGATVPQQLTINYEVQGFGNLVNGTGVFDNVIDYCRSKPIAIPGTLNDVNRPVMSPIGSLTADYRYDSTTSGSISCYNRALSAYEILQPNEIKQGTLLYPCINKNAQENFIVETLFTDIIQNIYESNLPGSSDTSWWAHWYTYLTSGVYHTNRQHGVSNAYYGALKKYVPTQYGTIDSLAYIPIDHNIKSKNTQSFFAFGGDIFISKFSFKQSHVQANFADSQESETFADDMEADLWRTMVSFFVESEVNCDLRHNFIDNSSSSEAGQTNLQGKFYPFNTLQEVLTDDDFLINGLPVNRTKGTFYSESIPKLVHYWAYEDNYNFNYYAYNTDYSKENDNKLYFGINPYKNFCNACTGVYPHTIIYSEKSYQDEIIDNYRVFKPNSLSTIPSHSGTIQGMFVRQDKLYVLTEQSVWFQPTKPQQIQTNENTVYVGTGDFLSIAPIQLIESNHGYGGTQHQSSIASSQYGVSWVDSKNGRIHLFSDQLKDISEQGLRYWTIDNSELELEKQLKTISLTNPLTSSDVVNDFNFDNPTSPHGVGFTSTYDPVNRRLILSKRDYKLTEAAIASFTGYADSGWQFNIEGIDYLISDLSTRKDLFEDRSFTLSYHYPTQKWISFHSYIPTWMWNTNTAFFSSHGDAEAWTHNAGSYQTFYGDKYPAILDFRVTPEKNTVSTFNNLTYYADVEQYDENTREYKPVRNVTFDSGYFYNSQQTSKIYEINSLPSQIPFYNVQSSTSANMDLTVDVNENAWTLSDFRDYSIYSNSLFSKEWSAIQGIYPIDRTINPNNINESKNPFSLEKMRDKYLGCRLFFNPPEDYRMSVLGLGASSKISFS